VKIGLPDETKLLAAPGEAFTAVFDVEIDPAVISSERVNADLQLILDAYAVVFSPFPSTFLAAGETFWPESTRRLPRRLTRKSSPG